MVGLKVNNKKATPDQPQAQKSCREAALESALGAAKKKAKQKQYSCLKNIIHASDILIFKSTSQCPLMSYNFKSTF